MLKKITAVEPKEKNKTTKHYNLEVDFFKRFLDPYMKYTSGLFHDEEEDLAVATRRMLDTIITMANINRGAHVLEIGPGWGAMLKRLGERNIETNYIGVSPSKVQNDYISMFKSADAQLSTSTFEQYEHSGEMLDAIIMMGSFCHLKNKKKQLARMKSLLAPEGCIIIEDTFFISDNDYALHSNNSATQFVQENIFGFAEILPLGQQLQQIMDAGLQVVSMLEHSDSYKYTIRRWIKNLKSLDDQKYPHRKDFIKYMNVAQKCWGRTTYNQLLVIKKAP